MAAPTRQYQTVRRRGVSASDDSEVRVILSPNLEQPRRSIRHLGPDPGDQTDRSGPGGRINTRRRAAPRHVMMPPSPRSAVAETSTCAARRLRHRWPIHIIPTTRSASLPASVRARPPTTRAISPRLRRAIGHVNRRRPGPLAEARLALCTRPVGHDVVIDLVATAYVHNDATITATRIPRCTGVESTPPFARYRHLRARWCGGGVAASSGEAREPATDERISPLDCVAARTEMGQSLDRDRRCRFP